MNKSRLESFSDGVFAFAITLLVLGVPVPDLHNPTDLALRAALLHSVAELAPYVTSFATIGIIWLNHHELLHLVDKVNHVALTLNLLLLLVVSFVPYPTAVLSRFGPMPSSACLYGVVLTFLGIAYSLLANYLHGHCIGPDASKAPTATRHKLRNAIGTVSYPLAALLALRWPRISVLIYFLLAGYYFVPGSFAPRAD